MLERFGIQIALDWVTSSVDTFEYNNAGQVLNWRGFIFNALTMERLDRQLVSYQYENGLQVLQISSFATINSDGLVPSIRLESNYDAFGNQILNATSIWDSFNEVWIANRNDYSYYNTPIVSTEEIFSDIPLEISPNPSSGQLQIRLGEELNLSKPIQLRVYNAMGAINVTPNRKCSRTHIANQYTSPSYWLVYLTNTAGLSTSNWKGAKDVA